MSIVKDVGFILKTFDFGETSKIVHIFTRDFGKVHGLLKGFKRSKKEFTTSLDLCSLNEFVFYQSRSSLWLVSSADIIHNFPYLKENLKKNSIANYIVELVDKISPLHLSSKGIFYLIKDSLFSLKGNSEKKIFYIFQIKILQEVGFKPSLTFCIKCNKEIVRRGFFSVKLGGLLCPFCLSYDKFSRRISEELILTLKYIQSKKFKIALRVCLGQKIETELKEILEEFFSYHLDTKIKSFFSMGVF